MKVTFTEDTITKAIQDADGEPVWGLVYEEVSGIPCLQTEKVQLEAGQVNQKELTRRPTV